MNNKDIYFHMLYMNKEKLLVSIHIPRRRRSRNFSSEGFQTSNFGQAKKKEAGNVPYPT